MSAAPTQRHYHSPIREERAARTRAAVLAAATRLFSERGWAASGMRDIAHAVGVAVETVYASFPSKAELLVIALEEALMGDSSPGPLTQRPEFAALSDASARHVHRLGQRTELRRRQRPGHWVSSRHRRWPPCSAGTSPH